MSYPSHCECKHWSLLIPMYEIGTCDAVVAGSIAAADHVPGMPGCEFGDADATGCKFWEDGRGGIDRARLPAEPQPK